jgi:hypothetical protein
MFVKFIEGFGNDGDTAIFEEEEVPVSYLLFWHIIPIELRYNGSFWNVIVERRYDIVTIPMFEQMSRKGLVVFSLAIEMFVVLHGEFGNCAHFGGEWHFLALHRFLDVGISKTSDF